MYTYTSYGDYIKVMKRYYVQLFTCVERHVNMMIMLTLFAEICKYQVEFNYIVNA